MNGDTTKDSDCDISSNDSTNKVTTNGINSDTEDSKSSESEDGNESSVCSNKVSDTDKNTNVDKICKGRKDKINELNNNNKDDGLDNKISNEKDEESAKNSDKTVNGDKKDGESPSDEDNEEKKQDAEVVFIQDLGFTVKIVSPGAEPLDIQVVIQLY